MYIQADAIEMNDSVEIARAAELLYARKGKSARSVDEFLGNSLKRMYKATPHKFWINLAVDVKNDPTNAKREITLP